MHIPIRVHIENCKNPLLNNLKTYTATNHEVRRRKSKGVLRTLLVKQMGPGRIPYLLWEATTLTPIFKAKFVLYIREDEAAKMLDIYLKSS